MIACVFPVVCAFLMFVQKMLDSFAKQASNNFWSGDQQFLCREEVRPVVHRVDVRHDELHLLHHVAYEEVAPLDVLGLVVVLRVI